MLTIIFLTVVLLYIIGFYYLITTRNLIRILIALEVLTKGLVLIFMLEKLLNKWQLPKQWLLP